MPIIGNRHENEGTRRRYLLALHELRRGLERHATPAGTTPRDVLMTPTTTRTQLVRQLRELIAALDRRVPHVERAGEAAIARDAALLKAKALKRIAEIEDRNSPRLPDSKATEKRTTAR
jgi:hypothetical protein